MAKSRTRSRLPRAISGPEVLAAESTLRSKTAVNASKYLVTGGKFVFHLCRRKAQTNSPKPKQASAGCGPESPSGIGKGGNRTRAQRKSNSHRCASSNDHQTIGSRRRGAANVSFSGIEGARAMSAAQRLIAIGAMYAAVRFRDALIVGCINPLRGSASLQKEASISGN